MFGEKYFQIKVRNDTMKRRLVAGRTDPDVRRFVAAKKSTSPFRPYYSDAGFHGWCQF